MFEAIVQRERIFRENWEFLAFRPQQTAWSSPSTPRHRVIKTSKCPIGYGKKLATSRFTCPGVILSTVCKVVRHFIPNLVFKHSLLGKFFLLFEVFLILLDELIAFSTNFPRELYFLHMLLDYIQVYTYPDDHSPPTYEDIWKFTIILQVISRSCTRI